MTLPRWLILLICALSAVAAAWWWQPTLFHQAWQPIKQKVSGETTLYRWKDGRGREQVSDTPPTDGTPFEVLSYRHNVNVIPEPQPDDD